MTETLAKEKYVGDPCVKLGPDKLTTYVWVVANVYLDMDNYDNLVTCGVVAGTLKAAKRVALEKAEDLLLCYNNERQFQGKPEISFSEAWDEVDQDDGIEHEYGYDPINSDVSHAAIRVFKCRLASNVKEVKLKW